MEESRDLYLYRVNHPVHGETEVEASDRYFAVTKAAKEWGLRWSTIARDCIVMQLSSRPVRKGKRPGKAEGCSRKDKSDKER